MIVALLIPLVAVALGVGLWFLLRGVGAFNVPGADPGAGYGGGGYRPSTWEASRGGSVRERIDALPQGCLIGVIVVSGLWILGWVIALFIGLSLLT
ncbi:MAG: hypothetical protein ACLGI2_17290 [Acidimicrobiia bacterium]